MVMNNIMWKVGAYSDFTRWDMLFTLCMFVLACYLGRDTDA